MSAGGPAGRLPRVPWPGACLLALFVVLAPLVLSGCRRVDERPAPPPARNATETAGGASAPAEPVEEPLPGEEAWRPILASGHWDDARLFCGELSAGPDDLAAASGHACLANLELVSCGTPAPTPECSGRALEQLEAAIERAPSQRRLHLGRLRVLLDAGRDDELAPALADTLAVRPGDERDLEKWMGYAFELIDAQRWRAAAGFTETLRERFPDAPQVLSTLGACLTDLGRVERAEEVLGHALQVAPGDPLVNWSLAWLHERTGRHDTARRFFETALARAPSGETLAAWGCAYASVLQARGALGEACRLQRSHCPPGGQTACGS